MTLPPKSLIEDGHWHIQTAVSQYELLKYKDEAQEEYIKRDHARALADRVSQLARFSKDYDPACDVTRYMSDIYAFSPEQMKEIKGNNWNKIWIDETVPKQQFYGPSIKEMLEPAAVVPEGHYKTDADAAKAWRTLWDALVKHNKEVKPGELGSPILAALTEIKRLQAIDRTLARRLKGK